MSTKPEKGRFVACIMDALAQDTARGIGDREWLIPPGASRNPPPPGVTRESRLERLKAKIQALEDEADA